MGIDIMSSKPKALYKIINIFLIIVNVNIGLVTLSVSSFTGFQFHERLIIAIPSLLLTLFVVLKEFKVKPLLKRIYLNLSIWVALMVIAYYIFVVW